MYRNDDPTAVASLPTPSAAGTQGYYGPMTIVTVDAINAIQEEICNAITALGLTLNKTQTNQLAQALGLLAPLNQQVDITGAHTFGPLDAGQTLFLEFGSGAQTWTIPAHGTSGIVVGSYIYGVVGIGSTLTIDIVSDTLYYPQGSLVANGTSRTITPTNCPIPFILNNHLPGSWILQAPFGVT